VSSRTIRLTLAYEGGQYSGWQRQKNQPTLQETLEQAVTRLTAAQTTVLAAGRTDAGVHALGQVASFTTDSRLTAEEFTQALNSLLPPDFRVLESREVKPDFHPRYQAEWKQYQYHLWAGKEPPLFMRRFVWPISRPLKNELLWDGLEALRGRHDFAAFQSTGSDVANTVRTMRRADLTISGSLHTFILEADGFLRHMVRAVVGTLVQLTGPGQMAEIIESRDRSQAGRTAPAKGLFLAWIKYPDQGEPVSAPGPFDPWDQSG